MFMWSYLDDISFHKRRYSRKELIRKVKAAGFKIKYCGGFVFSLFPLMLLMRIIKKNKEVSSNTNSPELEITPIFNSLLSTFMRFDEWLIRQGLNLPFGGSLILVAQKI